MTQRIIYSVLLIAITFFSSWGQSETDCQTLLNKHLDVDVNTVINKIKICGEFWGDDTLLLQGPILSPQIILLSNDKAVKYIDLITKLNEIRHNENYPLVLKALKEEKNSLPIPPAHKPMASFIPMANYQFAQKKAADNNKPLLIYFTSKNSVNSRNIERELFTDDDVIAILDKYVKYVANVDDMAIEKLQIEKFNSDVQPYLIIILNDRKIADFSGLSRDKNEFINFLRKGLK